DSLVDEFSSLVQQRVDHLLFRHHPDHLAFYEQMPSPPPGGDADVSLAGFAGTVDDTTHDRHLDGEALGFESFLRLGGDLDDIDLGPATRRTGDEVETGPLPQAQVLEELAPGLRLLDRVRGERETDRVPDPFHQERADASHGLDDPARGRSRLGHTEVERVLDLLREQPIGGDHRRHVGVLHRDLDVGEVDLFEVADLLQGRFDQRFGNGTPVLLQELLVERSGVDTDPDGKTALSGFTGDGLDVGLVADVARVEPEPLHPGLHRGESQAVLEMDVSDDGDGRARDDLG